MTTSELLKELFPPDSDTYGTRHFILYDNTRRTVSNGVNLIFSTEEYWGSLNSAIKIGKRGSVLEREVVAPSSGIVAL